MLYLKLPCYFERGSFELSSKRFGLIFNIQDAVEKSCPVSVSPKNEAKTVTIKLKLLFEEFDPSSGLTLAVCIIHASRAPSTMLYN
jgi:hypothetical protein